MLGPSIHTPTNTLSFPMRAPLPYLIAYLAFSACCNKLSADETKARLIQAASGVTEPSMPALVAQPEIAKALVRHEILRLVGTDGVAAIAKKPQGKAFLDLFLNDQSWMESFLCSGLVGNAALSLGHLADIQISDPVGMKVPLYRDLAVATALAYTAPFQRLVSVKETDKELPVDRYAFFKQSHRTGKLHASFENLKAWDMRFLISCAADNKSLAWLQDNITIPLSRFNGAEGCTYYLATNVFGNTIHGGGAAPGYHGPWTLGGASMAENAYRHGGVCGTQSNFASYVSVSRGIVSFAVGQPGHCAYAVRPSPRNWIGGFGGPGGHGQGIYGSASPVNGQLADAIFTQPAAVLASRRLAWLGALLKESDVTKARAALRAATLAQSLNVEAWQQYADLLTATEKQLPVAWKSVLNELTESDFFRLYPSALGFPLAEKICDRATAGRSEAERLEMIISLYEKSKDHLSLWPIELIFRNQMKSLPPAMQVKFAKALMRIIWTSPDSYNLHTAWGWIQKQFAAKKTPEEVTQMLEILTQPFDSRLPSGKPHTAGSRHMGGFISYVEEHFTHPAAPAAIAALTQCGWAGFEDARNKADIEVNRKIPAPPNYPGKLLSENGIVHLSADTLRWLPHMTFLHAGLLTPAGGRCQTLNQEKIRSVTVRLGTPGTLTGMQIVPMFESGERWFKNSLPLTVSVSDDNEKWTKVETLTAYQPAWTLDLAARNLKVRYVKLEVENDTPDYLQFRQILIYGTPSK